MSLRNKIIWLFVGLAVIPMLTLATFSYGFSRKLVERTVQSTLSESARIVQADIRAAVAQKETSADRAASSSPVVRAAAGRAMETEVEAQLSYVSDHFEFIRVRDGSGQTMAGLGVLPTEAARCIDGFLSRLILIRRPISGTGVSLEAGYWASELIDQDGIGPSYNTVVLDSRTRTVLLRRGCAEGHPGADSWLSGMLAGLDESQPGGGQLAFSAGGEDFLGAYLPLPEAGWDIVVAASPTPVLMPLGRLHLYYWLFVLVLTLSTVMAFSMLTGPITRSLQDLTRAAEEIGAGELNPWLPPPSGGEVGKLTLAVSLMADRLRDMMTQVERNGRLAVVGKLSAYLAHEIRNPLSSVKLNLQRLQRWADRGEIPARAAEPIEISLREVDRLAAAVTGVLQLSRPQDGQPEAVSLHQILVEAKSLLMEKFHAQGVALDLALDAGADRILARPGQIKSAVLNLMVNALEAQPSGGSLEVHSHLARRGQDQGPWIVLRFEDRGPGISEDVRDQIFEPFFTTKTSGSGIGLAVAQQNIRENGGSLALEEPERSEGGGAAFVVFLPLAPVGVDTRAEASAERDWARRPPYWRLRGRTSRGADSSDLGLSEGSGTHGEAGQSVSTDGLEGITYFGGEVN